jgi:hypothetical protein
VTKTAGAASVSAGDPIRLHHHGEQQQRLGFCDVRASAASSLKREDALSRRAVRERPWSEALRPRAAEVLGRCMTGCSPISRTSPRLNFRSMSKRPGSTHLCSGNVSTITVSQRTSKDISRRHRAANGSVKIVKKLVGAKPYPEFKTAIDSVLTPTPGGGGTQ